MKISDHMLEIERGRYKKIKREERKCKMCTMDVVEDEIHYFFHCPKYYNIRKDLQIIFNTLNTKNDTEKFIKIMSSPDHLRLVAPFIKKSLILRKVDSIQDCMISWNFFLHIYKYHLLCNIVFVLCIYV